MGRTKSRIRWWWCTLALLASSGAFAQDVTGLYPLTPIRVGASTVNLGLDVAGDVSQVLIAVSSSSATGAFGQLPQFALQKDRVSAMPFHLLVPLNRAFPADGVLTITAIPVSNGVNGATRVVTFDANAPGPSITAEPAVSTSTGAVVIEAHVNGTIAYAEATTLGVSSQILRNVKGSVNDAASGAFVRSTRAQVHARLDQPGVIRWSVPLTSDIPQDGVVIADLTFEDPFGRRITRSVVELASNALDTVTGLTPADCPDDGTSSCFRADGSGWVIVRAKDCVTSTADHCWFDHKTCTDSQVVLEPNFVDRASTKPFALEKNADWVAATARRP